MSHTIQPERWAKPKGYANGVLVPAGSATLYVAGQIAWDEHQNLVGKHDFGTQFRQALANVVEVVRTAGGEPSDLVDMTIYVTDKQRYVNDIAQVGAAWKELIGRHFPAMALVQVADLLEEHALVEIQAVVAL